MLDLLRRNGPLGRKALSDLAQLSTQAVADIIQDLVADGLLVDLGRRRQGRGQPPILYALNPAGGFAVGIEVAVGVLDLLALDLTGAEVAREGARLTDLSADSVFQEIEAAVRRLCARHPARLIGVGLVAPAPFGGEATAGGGPTALPGGAGLTLALARRLELALGVPVHVENDANAAAVAELLFGAGRGLGDFGLVYFGAGLGLGAVIRGQPLQGAHGGAGEIGHVITTPGGRACACGQSGCLERYASILALSERLQTPLAALTPERIDALLAQGAPGLLAWLDEAAAHLAAVLAMVETLLDPEVLLIGGRLPPAALDALIARMQAVRPGGRTPRVRPGLTCARSAARGAAALPLFNILTAPAADAAPPRATDADMPWKGAAQ